MTTTPQQPSLLTQAIRVYTVNPDINHDECMTLLAEAGIYLILDVNSPRIGESLNRYEPWTTYHEKYLEHIFKVVEQFSHYNNTLAFFAGNEVVNDDQSAMVSPNYIKAVVRDLKYYLANQSPRKIPVGYSAADDLKYRTSLAQYLECGDEMSSVDFYGVNSYQWCGEQSFVSSGYDRLVDDYRDYSLPLIFSEYGCNEVKPRTFQEVRAVYSSSMTDVFSGGLIYEYSQEPNDYGLVQIYKNHSAQVLEDFEALKKAYNDAPKAKLSDFRAVERPQKCELVYPNINTMNPLPDTFGLDMITRGVRAPRGKYVDLHKRSTSYAIYDLDGNVIEDTEVQQVIDLKEPLAAPPPSPPARKVPVVPPPKDPVEPVYDEYPKKVPTVEDEEEFEAVNPRRAFERKSECGDDCGTDTDTEGWSRDFFSSFNYANLLETSSGSYRDTAVLGWIKYLVSVMLGVVVVEVIRLM